MANSAIPQDLGPAEAEMSGRREDHETQASLSRPPLQSLDTGSTSSGSSSATLTTLELSSLTPTRSGLTSPSSASTTLSPSSPLPHKSKPIRRKQRPTTAPSGSSGRRPMLLPSHSSTRVPMSGFRIEDDKPVYGYSISRGRSPQHEKPERQTQQMQRGSSGLRGGQLAGAHADFVRAVEGTVMGGVVANDESVSPLIVPPRSPTSPSPSSPLSRNSRPRPGAEWPGFSEDAAEPRDWSAFTRAYSLGQWDPYKIPLPPKPSPPHKHPHSSNGRIGSHLNPLQRNITAGPTFSSPKVGRESAVTAPNDMSYAPGPSSPNTRGIRSPSAPPTPSIAVRRGLSAEQYELHVNIDAPTPPSRLSAANCLDVTRPSLTSANSDPTRSSSSLHESPEPEPKHSPSLEHVAAAATMRWAGAGVHVAPLALPSPESELMDPMRRMLGATSPGVSSKVGSARVKLDRMGRSETPPASAPPRVKSFAERNGLAFGPDGSGRPTVSPRLDTIRGSPAGSPGEGPTEGTLIHGTDPKTPHTPPPSTSPGSTMLKRLSRSGGNYVIAPPPMGSPIRNFPPARNHPHFPSTLAASVPANARLDESEDYFGRPVSNYEKGNHQRPTQSTRPQTFPAHDQKSDGSIGSPLSLRRGARTPEPVRAKMESALLPSIHHAPSSPNDVESGGRSREVSVAFSKLANMMNPGAFCGPSDVESSTHVMGSSSDFAMNSLGPSLPAHSNLNTPSSLDGITQPQIPGEISFAKLGYLEAPFPPDERARRQALHKYSALYTAKDVNFDRIAHLAKLVFNTKVVVIALIDGQNQWHKSESGLGIQETDRAISLCAHTILQRGDEPMVILDASKDWRFKGNPQVVGDAHLRFYAGAPLRTAEGYNVGSLCVVDDVPRDDFSPRSRHTLKEFAAIVVRELELWRDTIQLRIRDRIQTSMETFTRECLEMEVPPEEDKKNPEASMQRVYQQAAALVKDTLGVDGALVLDVSHFEVMESLADSDEGGDGPKRTVFYHGDLYDMTAAPLPSAGTPLGGPKAMSPDSTVSNSSVGPGERTHVFGTIPPLPILGADEDPASANPDRESPLNGEDHAKLSKFLSTCTEGRIYERLPSCFRKIMPKNIQYAMIVPVFNVDKRPFLLLCAYTVQGATHFMEGYELQYLRAVGVIILSAVLKRRMILADTAKSLFISNISHELRTPLHGILASAELLRDTRLSNTQLSYLKTVQTCATSLVETVNHVLDFTKLSGNAKEGVKQHPIKLARLDLKYLIDEIVEGCWLGARARAAVGTEEIGSVYAPPKSVRSPDPSQEKAPTFFVETVTDIAYRPEGWWVMSDAGGIRRVLMNLIGNSIKFTKDGFIHVRLRELPHEPSPGKTTIEIAVYDSGKGISKDFLQNRMFQPFSQENPLQTGTGLGLAIVNSIGTSLGGKVEVWSAEGVGTEIRLVMEVTLVEKGETPRKIVDPTEPVTVSMVGFDETHKGIELLRETVKNYLVDWWGFTISEDIDGIDGEILVVNEDPEVLQELTAAREFIRPVVLLSSARGDSQLTIAVNNFERLGGWCRIVFKPSGPVRLGDALTTAVYKMDGLRRSPAPSSAGQTSGSYQTAQEWQMSGEWDLESNLEEPSVTAPLSPKDPVKRLAHSNPPSVLTRRRSEEHNDCTTRPPLGARSSTYTGTPLRMELPMNSHTAPEPTLDTQIPADLQSQMSTPTMPLAEDGSVMLKSVVGTSDAERKSIVLLVDDNVVNRNLLAHWLNKRGYEFQQACDGQEAIDVFSQFPAGYFECVTYHRHYLNHMRLILSKLILMDLSMPRKNGFEASEEIRKIERTRRRNSLTSDSGEAPHDARSKIFALTGLASIEDKRKAFAAGVDGYLIKPVSLKTLASVFQRLKNG
ncbi:His Kinase A domain containing protein [Tulasnella sp. 330]|nr:His Kinase A domain containing protein [Tulasnella sp. 330]